MKITLPILICIILLLPFKVNAICLPCDPCWISGVGGPITDLGGVGEMVSKGISEGQKQVNFAKQKVNSFVNQTITTLQNGATQVLDDVKGSAQEMATDMFGESKK